MRKVRRISSLKQNMPLRIQVFWDVIMAQLFATFQRNAVPLSWMGQGAQGWTVEDKGTVFAQYVAGLFLGTLRWSWDLWWLSWVSIRNPRGKPWTSCLLPTFLTWSLPRRWRSLLLSATPNVLNGSWLRGLSLIEVWNGWHIPSPVARGTEGCCPLPGQDFSCLPGYWLCSNHMALGQGSVYT